MHPDILVYIESFNKVETVDIRSRRKNFEEFVVECDCCLTSKKIFKEVYFGHWHYYCRECWENGQTPQLNDRTGIDWLYKPEDLEKVVHERPKLRHL